MNRLLPEVIERFADLAPIAQGRATATPQPAAAKVLNIPRRAEKNNKLPSNSIQIVLDDA